MQPIFSLLIDEAVFLIATLFLGFLYVRVDGSQFPRWSQEYEVRRRSTVGAHLPSPQLEMFRVDLWHLYAMFLLPVIINLILLKVVLPESVKTLGWFVPILVVEGILGWFIQRQRIISFARDWLVYRRLTEPENHIVVGTIQFSLSYSTETGGRMVSFCPAQSLEVSASETRPEEYYFLPTDVAIKSEIPAGKPVRIIVRPLRNDEKELQGARGVIVGVLSPQVPGCVGESDKGLAVCRD